MDNYFARSGDSISVHYFGEPEPDGKPQLREAQVGAFWGVCSYFTTTQAPAIVVMPTGSGKTALMTLLASVVPQKRLLIIAPTRVIREQISREFTSLRVAKASGSLPENLAPPTVFILRNQLKELNDWLGLAAYEVIVSTSKCISPKEKGVYSDPPKELFDAIFFDEAQHLPARTWDDIVQHFPDARVISFTATPYRNDRKPVTGEIAYAYPLARAIQKGIYQPIEFVPVDSGGTRGKRPPAGTECPRNLGSRLEV